MPEFVIFHIICKLYDCIKEKVGNHPLESEQELKYYKLFLVLECGTSKAKLISFKYIRFQANSTILKTQMQCNIFSSIIS